jgi:hypothetical protein
MNDNHIADERKKCFRCGHAAPSGSCVNVAPRADADTAGACVHADDPKACYRVRCQLGNKCVDDDMSFRKSHAAGASNERADAEPASDTEEADALRAFDKTKRDGHSYDLESYCAGHIDKSAERADADTAGAKQQMTLTGAQLLEAFDFVAPSGDPDQLECEVTIAYGEGNDYYCWLTDHPEEGSMLLDGTTAESIAAGASNERADAEKDAALTDDERKQLDGIVRCDPSWLLMDIRENSAFDAKIVEKVFELAKQQARAILAAKEKKS